MAVTLKDIARLADVSPATVSLVLNNRPGVGDQTREKILALSAKLGYQGPRTSVPNVTIRFLHISRHGHTVIRDHDVFIADYIEGLGRGAKHQGLKLEILTFRSTSIEKILEIGRAHV